MPPAFTLIRSSGRYLRISRKPFESLISKNRGHLTNSLSTLIPFKLADIGEGIAEVELMKWFVKEGDDVKSFDRICEVQSDKATVEITSRYDGKVVRLHYTEGAIVKVGSALVDIQATESNNQTKLVNEQLPKAKESSADENEEIRIIVKSDEVSSLDKILTTPAVRKLAKENRIDLTTVHGTGPRGRILKEDILSLIYKSGGISTSPSCKVDPDSSLLNSRNNQSVGSRPNVTSSQQPPADIPINIPSIATEDKKVPIRGIQRLMVKSMNAANQVKHLTLGEEISCDRLILLRKSLKSLGYKRNIKISYMPIIIKATSLALLQFPMLNATVNEDVSEMIYHVNHNIGIAMDTPSGLVVPVIKQIQKKTILEIAEELNAVQEAAARGLIASSQLSGGTFTLSNIGSLGGTYAVPVLVMPQVCIGAIGRILITPRYVDSSGSTDVDIDDIESGKAVIRPSSILNVSWSADHRVIDGATVARFSNLWKSYIESPEIILANMR